MEWLAHGDYNSSYFYNKASERLKKNTIKGLSTNFGDWCMEPGAFLEIVFAYFGDIFFSSHPSASDMDVVSEYVIPKVLSSMNANF